VVKSKAKSLAKLVAEPICRNRDRDGITKIILKKTKELPPWKTIEKP